ncbi:hypothetical protein [Methanobrevibacter sp.]|uniref:hypothetical protein n=1 Tax=Methanobrevibacter sp. TaxID=66852 RepID=UPI003976D5BF
MIKLEGIIYKAFENFIVFRGYAPIGILSKVSKRPEAYQRMADETHKRDIIKFLGKKDYSYFPELVLAYRGADLNGLIDELHGKDDVEYNAESYVKGLKVLKERVPVSGYRARHAQLQVDDDTLLRVDGNHRLEAFDESDEWWKFFIEEEAPIGYSDEEKAQWLHHKVSSYKQEIENIIVPFSIVISNYDIADKFEASIFNNINFKQLPLKQEKNIQNVYKYLKDSDELGAAHVLTIKLIELVEEGHFKGLSLLAKGTDNEIYRTVCFKTIDLLLVCSQKAMSEIEDKEKYISKCEAEVKNQVQEIEKLQKQLSLKTARGPKDQIEGRISKSQRLIDELRHNTEVTQKQIEVLKRFIKSSDNIDDIEIAIQSLRSTYAKLGDNYGNISMFVALVYFKLFDENKFVSFVEWIIKNGINKIPVEDYLPTHSAESLIALFNRVYEAKGREVFISMQFNDPQSEMIYEKVVQTIEKFNQKKGLDIKITMIRIDQKATTEMFTISNEITRAIENSSLIIADLSSHNVNVYHEIGVAMGIAQAKLIPAPVILLYKTDSTFRDEKTIDADHFIGFNLRGESQLRFETYKQLQDGLWERLEKHYEV